MRDVLSVSDASPLFSAGVWAGDLLFLSGTVGRDPATGRVVPGGVRAELAAALATVDGVLAAAGLGFDDVVQVRLFLTDMADYDAMNAEYLARVRAPRPARTCVAVRGLPLGASVEVEVVARRPRPEGWVGGP